MNKKINRSDKKVTIAFGYGLFALTVLGVITTTIIPWSKMLLNPMARHSNIMIMMVTFVVAAILPPLVAYIMGDRSTHGKDRSLHHYNGVLFGIAAYWLTMGLTAYTAAYNWEFWNSIPDPYRVLLLTAYPWR